VAILLLSTYDLGRQPFGLASPSAWLERAGFEVCCRDLSRDPLHDDDVRRASLVAFYLPMHTATRLALPVIDRVRSQNPSATICAYGLYAPLSETLLRERGVTAVIGPEAEEELVRLAGGQPSARPDAHSIPRLAFITPDRKGLPALGRYAALRLPDGSERIAGATEATRGCKHRCRHCPIVPVYDGHFRVVPADVVLADIEQQVNAGAAHITFGDPDFLNGPTHARRIVETLHARHPSLTYDVTIKVEHLLKHRELVPVLAETGCLFVTSAVESVDDRILEKLEKGHSRADFAAAADLCRSAGLALAPTFVAFTPWTTLDGYRDLLDTVECLGLVEHVAPVQWGLRLLVTCNSRLLELEDIATRVGPFDPRTLTHPWMHDDPRVDTLQAEIMRMVGVRLNGTRADTFDRVRRLAEGAASSSVVDLGRDAAVLRKDVLPSRTAIPYLNEPWYC